MEELKPCPFCGGNAKLTQWTKTIYSISCIKCDAHFYTYTKEEAIKAWNTRHERTVKLKDNGHCPDCRKLVGTGENYCAWCGAKVVRE